MTDLSIIAYTKEIAEQLKSGQAREHGYRPALERLMRSFDNVGATNDPRRSEFGNPDMIFYRASNHDIILGYAEAKDINIDLDKTAKTEQLQRYAGYNKLFLTNYLDFTFYRNGEEYERLSLGKLRGQYIDFDPTQFARLEHELQAFLESDPEPIKSGKSLALIMGQKARRLRDNVSRYIGKDNSGELENIYQMMRELLVHDLSHEKFADMYAQTLVYGLFTARYNDPTPEDFSRGEASELVPVSNPFLREFFAHIGGVHFDKRLAYIVDELCAVFAVSNVQLLVEKHLRLFEIENEKDPIIHFYEDFLKEYDPAERKRMGAYYTPVPVVRYIVREVDRILKEEFGIAKGLVDDSKISHAVEVGQDMRYDRRSKQKTTSELEFHRVQILDPAVGTATFLNETIKFIASTFKNGQEGRWPQYTTESLVPRLSGFELMMAPYTIAHLKLGMTLQESGIDQLNERLGIYLTNTLEEGVLHKPTLFDIGLLAAVTEESRQASAIKHDRPVMVVMGNPPYSGVSSNETIYANSLIDKYKVEPGGTLKLHERKHWLNDDYVKFIAFAEDMIAKSSGGGIVAMITNNGYLENQTFRGMRWHLTQTFDKIYVLDLHGNSKKKEVSPNGSKDENVFDIMQGVNIILAIKNVDTVEGQPANVYHAELYGKRQAKFNALDRGIFDFKPLTLDPTYYYFVPKELAGKAEYDKGIALNELFKQNVAGIVTARDGIVIDTSKSNLLKRIERFTDPQYSDKDTRQWLFPNKQAGKYEPGDTRGWKLDSARQKIALNPHSDFLQRISYRPFDTRWIYYSPDMVDWGREKMMSNFIGHDNLGLIFERSVTHDVFVIDHLTEHAFLGTAGYAGNTVPLYIYHEDGSKTANFDPRQFQMLTAKLTSMPSPEKILDYIYGILHSPNYVTTYKHLLTDGYPRVPIPDNDVAFEHYAHFGNKLRELHLMKDEAIGQINTTYPVPGSNLIEKITYHPGDSTRNEGRNNIGNVYINNTQFFGNITASAWNFTIGGYQPAQKWLKERKGQQLSGEDLGHFQKIIKILEETTNIMNQIDQI